MNAPVPAITNDQLPPVPAPEDTTGVVDKSPVRLAAAIEGVVIAVVGLLVAAGWVDDALGGAIITLVGALVIAVGEFVRNKTWSPATVAKLVTAGKAVVAAACNDADAARQRAETAEAEKAATEGVLTAELDATRNVVAGIAAQQVADHLAPKVVAAIGPQPLAQPPEGQPPNRASAPARGIVVQSVVRVDKAAPRFAGQVAAVIDVGEPARNDHQADEVLVRPVANQGGDGWLDGRWVELWPPTVVVEDRTNRAGAGPRP